MAHSQEKYVVDWDFTGQSFEDFVLKAESRYPVRFFYNKEWVKNLTLGSYGEKRMLNEILDTLFKGESIYYYALESGNIILTKYFAIKTVKESQAENQSYIPGMDYSEDEAVKSYVGKPCGGYRKSCRQEQARKCYNIRIYNKPGTQRKLLPE